MIELGITTFGETTILEETNQSYSHPERIRQLVAEIELADQVGLDVYGIGEHHREDFAVSAPEIILAAGAVRTNNIRLSSAVTILSSKILFASISNFQRLTHFQMVEQKLWQGVVPLLSLFHCLDTI